MSDAKGCPACGWVSGHKPHCPTLPGRVSSEPRGEKIARRTCWTLLAVCIVLNVAAIYLMVTG